MLKKYRCEQCEHIYDPAIGDSEHGAPAGTEFRDLPEGWTCPVCHAAKDKFVGIMDDHD